MKKLLIFATTCIFSASNIAWKAPSKIKPANTPSIASIKLAEAKAILSKAKHKQARFQLATADGGI